MSYVTHTINENCIKMRTVFMRIFMSHFMSDFTLLLLTNDDLHK